MILLNFDTQIKGDSSVENHTDWITCDSVQFGVGRAISTSGGGRDREVSNPSFSEVTFTKSTDIASGDLYYQAVQGKSLGKAPVHFVQTGGTDTSPVYLTVERTDASVSSYSASSGGERPSESFSLNFTKIMYKYDAFTGDTIVTGTEKKWDVMANKQF
jgi:type VI secretion system secreted protein Hcp